MKPFEDDVLELISNIKYQRKFNQFQQKLAQDCQQIKQSRDLIVKSDKTNNNYRMPVQDYKTMLKQNVTKSYKKTNTQEVFQTNLAAQLAKQLEIDDRIETLSELPAYVTIKDHKDTFPGRMECRLINPSKTKMGLISKKFLENINHLIRKETKLNQWQSTIDVLRWFENLEGKQNFKFFKFDIESFYPSINEELLEKSITFAELFTEINETQKKIIRHSRKTFLFLDGATWIKKNSPDFDVPMGAYDPEEISELVGLFLLHQLKQLIPQTDVGLYRDDGLAIVKASGPEIDRLRKKVICLFKSNSLNVTIETNVTKTNFLDVTLDLSTKSFKSYNKPSHIPRYININSCHPPTILKNLPSMIGKRLSIVSSSEEMFDSEKAVYSEALKSAGFKHDLKYNCNARCSIDTKSKHRKRKILWFNPPFNIAKQFLNLLDKHFPKSSPLHKIFNRNNVKVSYSCMPNMNSKIANKNKHLLGDQTIPEEKKCNCRKGVKNCPLNGKCLTESLVYKAEVATTDQNVNYIGMTSTSFKTRFNNHTASFNHKRDSNTSLSNFIWQLKEKNQKFDIKWSILRKAPAFKSETNK